MSRYYGTVLGSRSPASRQGSKATGLRVAAQSWSGSVIVQLEHDGEGDRATIGTGEGSTTAIQHVLWRGPLAALMAADRIDLSAGPED